LRENRPELITVARPYVFTPAGSPVLLDGSKSWSRSGPVARDEWTFHDSTAASGPTVEREYRQADTYNEVLTITDRDGRLDHNFAVVQVINLAYPDQLPPTIHAASFPTTGIHPGAPVTFKVRSFRAVPAEGRETWDFDDGSPAVTVQSDGNGDQHAKDGYAVTTHRFDRPGRYLVRVDRANRHGIKATARLYVIVAEAREQ
jgi:hypothetical protein